VYPSALLKFILTAVNRLKPSQERKKERTQERKKRDRGKKNTLQQMK
jgi:hypothetical protein